MGTYLPKPKTEKMTVVGQYPTTGQPKIKYIASGMQGWRVNMEDAEMIEINMSNNINLFGVFDGHGGQEVAKYCERHFKETLIKNSNYEKGNYKEALVETFQKMDEQLETQKGKKELMDIKKQCDPQNQDQESMAGCTANVCLITPQKLYVANAGDSRSVFSFKGQAKEMSEDHKPDNELEKNRITKAGGEVWEGRVNGNLNLSRAIGDMEYKQDKNLKWDEQLIIAKPDVTEWDIQKEGMIDFIIMGCDGIWECKSNQQIVDYFNKALKNKENMKLSCEKFLDSLLAKDTNQMYGLDNMSVIFIEFVK